MASSEKLAPGPSTIRIDFKYDGGGVGERRRCHALCQRQEGGEGRVEKTVPGRFSAGRDFDIGLDMGSPVSDDYKSPNPYTGTLRKVGVRLEPMEHAENDIKTIRKAELKVWFAME